MKRDRTLVFFQKIAISVLEQLSINLFDYLLNSSTKPIDASIIDQSLYELLDYYMQYNNQFGANYYGEDSTIIELFRFSLSHKKHSYFRKSKFYFKI